MNVWRPKTIIIIIIMGTHHIRFKNGLLRLTLSYGRLIGATDCDRDHCHDDDDDDDHHHHHYHHRGRGSWPRIVIGTDNFVIRSAERGHGLWS